MDMNEVKEFCDRQEWIKTISPARKSNLEYIVGSDNDKEFVFIEKFIRENGITINYCKYPFIFIKIGEKLYWVDKYNSDRTERLIDRCDLENFNISIEWKWPGHL